MASKRGLGYNGKMMDMTPAERLQKIRRITVSGLMLNVLLMAAKILSGILIRSSALIADGIHSGSDLATDFVVLVSARVSNRPADETHPFGHRKFETVAAQVIAVFLGFVSFELIWESGKAILQKDIRYPGFFVLVIAGVSILGKEIMFRATRKVSHQTNSPSLYANAWHHRSDAFSSVAVFFGGIAGLFGWGYADHAATIVVGLMIIMIAGKIFYAGLIELTDQSADKESLEKIGKILSEDKRILNWHRLRTRKVGGELFLDMHILVHKTLSVGESHAITVEIEDKVKKALPYPVNILIHVEPEGSQHGRTGMD